ncbi:MAG: PAS domain S-box protein, partial [Smithella sp.]
MKNEKQTKEQLFNEPGTSEIKNKPEKNPELLLENFYKTIFENTKTAIIIIDEDNTILGSNRELEKLTGYTKAEMAGRKKWTEFVARKDELKQMKENHRLRLIDPASAPEKYEFQFVNREGEIKNILLTATLLPGTKQTLATLLDISDRRRVENALTESERRLTDIFEFLPDPTFAINLSGKIIAWNKAMEELTGIETKDMLGKGKHELEMLLRGINKPLMIEQAMGVAEVNEKDFIYVKKEGNVLIAEAELTLRGKSLTIWGKAAPLRDSQGHIIGAIQSFHDITERKQIEKSLQHSEAILRSVFNTAPIG